MDTIVQIMGSFGFPVAACVAMGAWVKKIIDRQQAQFDVVIEAHKEESRQWQEVLKENTTAINNLRDVLSKVK